MDNEKYNNSFSVLVILSTKLLGQNNITSHIIINYVYPNIETFIAVNCEDFESSFQHIEYKSLIINDTAKLMKLENEYKRIKYYRKSNEIDVRYKLSIYFKSIEGMPLIICMDRFKNAIMGGRRIRNCKFKILLGELIDSIPK
jgi:hypothetical protein